MIKVVLQSYVRSGTAFLGAWQESEVLTEKKRAALAFFQVVPLWISGILPYHVWDHGLPDLSRVLGSGDSSESHRAVLDIQSTLEMGL